MIDPGMEQSIRGLAGLVTLRPLDVDDFSTVRYVTANAVTVGASSALTDEEAKSFAAHVYSPEFVDALMGARATVGILDQRVVAIGAWAPSDDAGSHARVLGIFVEPIYSRSGIGRRLLTHIEREAMTSGFKKFAARATANAVPFFHSAGYEVASHGVSSHAVVNGTLPVTFMRKSV